MSENPIIVFGMSGLLGLAVMILGLKTSGTMRRLLETLGAVAFHVGVFGILYFKVSLVLFTGLVALVLSLFVLIDPLKISLYVPLKPFRIFGFLLLFTAVAFCSMYATHFPVWLWGVAFVLYIAPYALPFLKPKIRSFQYLAWLLVLTYSTLISYAMYAKFYPDVEYGFLTRWFAQPSFTEESLEIPDLKADSNDVADVVESSLKSGDSKTSETALVPEKTVSTDATLIVPKDEKTLDSGPFLKSLKEADDRYLKLKKDYEDLKKKFDALEQKLLEMEKTSKKSDQKVDA